MFQFRKRRSARLLTVAAVLALTFSAGAAFTALGQPTPDTFFACLRDNRFIWVNTTGNLPCNPPGQVVSWGAEGQPGPPGPPGPQGEPGPELVNIRTGHIFFGGPVGQDATFTETGVGVWQIDFPAGTFPPAPGQLNLTNFPAVRLTSYEPTPNL